MAASPRRVPTAAPAAKSGPCSRARNTETGAEVRGKPESHPPTPCPHRRATRVATAIRSGVTTSLSTITPAGIPPPPLTRRTLARGEVERQFAGRARATGAGPPGYGIGHDQLGHVRSAADGKAAAHRAGIPRAVAAEHGEPESPWRTGGRRVAGRPHEKPRPRRARARHGRRTGGVRRAAHARGNPHRPRLLPLRHQA